MEFGWLLQFQARARYKAKDYDNVIVYCEEGNEYLYQDFSTKIVTFKRKKGWRDRYMCGGSRLKIPKDIYLKYKADKLYTPTNDHCINDKAEFYMYGSNCMSRFKILIHARNLKKGDWIDKACGGNHNWPTGKWDEFVKRQDIPVACVGTKKGARLIEGTIDLRGSDMEDLCNIMYNADVIVGESSGPLHLASLCGCPQVIITHARPEKSLNGKTNKWRYVKGWNPFKTTVKVVEHPRWNPPVEKVLKATEIFA